MAGSGLVKAVDVIIVGGGSAGVSAAVSAARSGASTVLIEKSERLGGTSTHALVHTICGLYEVPNAPNAPNGGVAPKYANGGLPEEVAERLISKSHSKPELVGRVYVLPNSPEIFCELLMEMVEEESLLELMLGYRCVSIEDKGEEGFRVLVTDSDGVECVVTAAAVVDASADAVLASHFQTETMRAESSLLQRPAYIFGLEGVRPGAIDEAFRMRFSLSVVREVKSGGMPSIALGSVIRSSPGGDGCFVSTDLDGEGGSWDPDCETSRAAVLRSGEALAHRLRDFLKENFDAFEKVSDPILPEVLGVRESHRWHGQKVLSADDLIEGRQFSDVVAYAAWPMELRETTKGPRLTFFNDDSPSPVPLGCLVSKGISGVFFAGRCLSATHEALASLRVIGTCLATGQAAGVAAALYSQGVRDLEQQARIIRERIGITFP